MPTGRAVADGLLSACAVGFSTSSTGRVGHSSRCFAIAVDAASAPVIDCNCSRTSLRRFRFSSLGCSASRSSARLSSFSRVTSFRFSASNCFRSGTGVLLGSVRTANQQSWCRAWVSSASMTAPIPVWIKWSRKPDVSRSCPRSDRIYDFAGAKSRSVAGSSSPVPQASSIISSASRGWLTSVSRMKPVRRSAARSAGRSRSQRLELRRGRQLHFPGLLSAATPPARLRALPRSLRQLPGRPAPPPCPVRTDPRTRSRMSCL